MIGHPKKYIGIDTGVKTGFSVWDVEKQDFEQVDTLTIYEALERVIEFHRLCGGEILVRVEDARLRKWFGSRGREVLQGVGSVKRDCGIWQEVMQYKGINVEFVAPKNNKTKLKSTAFKAMTGWQKRTSEHSRDAAMLVYGFREKV